MCLFTIIHGFSAQFRSHLGFIRVHMLLSLIALLSFIGWLVLALRAGHFWHPLLDPVAPFPAHWPSVDIIVPARNEALSLPKTLPTLLAQNYAGQWRVMIVNDNSDDGTATIADEIAKKLGKTDHLVIINAPPKPTGWSGKVAAMHAGVSSSTADYILFTDADIAHTPDSLQKLVADSSLHKLDLNSRMVMLNCTSVVEKLLIPAFIFFFAMLYPFRQANKPNHKTAAAAGGTMLVRRSALDNIGGMAAIKSALIDDCSLAKAIKTKGGDGGTAGRIKLTLTRSIHSLREYPEIKDVWQMIARTAFTQLNHSLLLLAGSVIGLIVIFSPPLLAVISTNFYSALLAFLAWILMSALYFPLVRFYGLPIFWCFTLPFAAIIYIAATIDSARLYWQGRGGQWKGRSQA